MPKESTKQRALVSELLARNLEGYTCCLFHPVALLSSIAFINSASSRQHSMLTCKKFRVVNKNHTNPYFPCATNSHSPISYFLRSHSPISYFLRSHSPISYFLRSHSPNSYFLRSPRRRRYGRSHQQTRPLAP
jgi:hypothetical protein